MAHRLEKLTIKGFKSIKSLEEFELTNLNILIGGNGAGKSNFVDFFRMISAMMKQDGLKEFIAGNCDSYLYGGTKQTKNISIELIFGQNGYDFELAPTEGGNNRSAMFLNSWAITTTVLRYRSNFLLGGRGEVTWDYLFGHQSVTPAEKEVSTKKPAEIY